MAIVRSGLRAVDPADLVEGALRADSPFPESGGRLLVVAVGKAGGGMLRGARRALGDSLGEALAVVPKGLEHDVPDGILAHTAGHPLPDADGVRASREVERAVEGLGEGDRLLLLLSGGGSALMTLPAEPLQLADLRAVTAALLGAGAPIGELNTVRKHLEVLKGGGLARLASPASVRALILSDVVGDPLDVIASGPVSPDPSTFEDAMAVLRDRGVWSRVPASVRSHLEAGVAGTIRDTPEVGEALFENVSVSVIGNAARAAEGAAVEAKRLGYRVTVDSVTVTGEAREVGARLGAVAHELPRGVCRILAGETTVTVAGDGRGGRNQEVALSAAEALEGRDDVLLFSVGTDGVDGPTDAAGAWVTGQTLQRARGLGLDARDALARNDSYTFFRELGDLVMTGPTGTNVMDLMGILAAPMPPGSRPSEPAR